MIITRLIYVVIVALTLLLFFFGAAYAFTFAIEHFQNGQMNSSGLLAVAGVMVAVVGAITLTKIKHYINI